MRQSLHSLPELFPKFLGCTPFFRVLWTCWHIQNNFSWQNLQHQTRITCRNNVTCVCSYRWWQAVVSPASCSVLSLISWSSQKVCATDLVNFVRISASCIFQHLTWTTLYGLTVHFKYGFPRRYTKHRDVLFSKFICRMCRVAFRICLPFFPKLLLNDF